jgi:hypothetical protein
VIELPIENLLDINGWEIREALALLNKSNPVLFEWLSSPVFYLCNQVVVDDMRSLSGWDYHRGAASHHYQHLAESSFKQFVEKVDTPRIKKYFYALRPALALRWLRENSTGIIPMSLPELLDGTALNPELRNEIDHLVHRKNRRRSWGNRPAHNY